MQTNAQGQLQATATYLTGPRGTECRVDETTQSEGYYLAGYHDANNAWVNPNHADGTPFARGKTAWYVYDGLGSVVGEVDFNGNLTTSAKYDVYGAKRLGGTGTASSRQGFVGSLGHVTDTETGLVYMRARYYDPNVGRFISQDPQGNGNNWFVYTSNNPTNKADFSGKNDVGEDLLNEILTAILECPVGIDWFIQTFQVKPTEAFVKGVLAGGSALAAGGTKVMAQLRNLMGTGDNFADVEQELEYVVEEDAAVNEAKGAAGLGAEEVDTAHEDEE